MIARVQWEYQLFIYKAKPDLTDDATEMGELLKSRGELGWELVSVARADGRRELYFKRPKEAVPSVG